MPTKYQIKKQQSLLTPNWQRVTIAGQYDGVKMSLIDWLIKSGERLFETIEIDNLTPSLRLIWKIVLGFDGIGSFIQRGGKSNVGINTKNQISGMYVF